MEDSLRPRSGSDDQNKGGRRNFIRNLLLIGGAGILSGGLWKLWKDNQKEISFGGELYTPDFSSGHKLRDGYSFPPPAKEEYVDYLIVGGGIAGLSAARYLKKQNANFLLLELEKEVGGNSLSGKNEISEYPWAAHYVPIPEKGMTEIVELFQEYGLIQGENEKGELICMEDYLCSDPQERLLYRGKWQDGLIPQLGLDEDQKRQYKLFFEWMEKYKYWIGDDGGYAFAIPVDKSSLDKKFRDLDLISMKAWMDQQEFTSETLRWYVNYCCLDDYGAGMQDVSAWAGIHYFAARRGKAANAEPGAAFTWPEGNGFLVKKLHETISPKLQPSDETIPQNQVIRSGVFVYKLETEEGFAFAEYLDVKSQSTVRIKAKKIICCVPQFIAQRLLPERYKGITSIRSPLPSPSKRLSVSETSNHQVAQAFQYHPWVVANISIKGQLESTGQPLSWDNVKYGSPSLGYVNATHQDVRMHKEETVLTWYLPLSGDPSEERKKAMDKKWEDWKKIILEDLESMHKGISYHITRMDIRVWGHGMIRPSVGFIWGKEREESKQNYGNILFAHSDLSGISIFEEAFYQGLNAAKVAIGVEKNV